MTQVPVKLFRHEVDEDFIKSQVLFVGVPMYGGQCYGSFAKSMQDLVTYCKDLGVELKIYYLFNESLITRARNYVVDEFKRSGQHDGRPGTHMMFIDSDISFNPRDVIGMMSMMTPDSPYDVVCGAYPKKSASKQTLIQTQDGPKTIHEIVETRYSGKVLSMGKDGVLEYKRVLDWMRSPHQGMPWVKIQSQNQKGVIVTADHKVPTITNPLRPNEIQWIEAGCINDEHYVLRNPRAVNSTNNENTLYNPEQLSCLIGTLLGDGSIDGKGYLKFGHSTAQAEYLSFKAELFGGAVQPTKKVGSYKGKDYHAQFLYCPRNAQIDYLRTLMYPEGKKKFAPVAEYIDARALAMWFLDDGWTGANGNGRHVVFCTENFGEENHDIVRFLKDKFDVDAVASKHGESFRVRIRSASQEKFFRLIAPYCYPSMLYKIPVEYQTTFQAPSFKRLDISAKKATMEQVKIESDQYDIMVEDNFNFVADGYVVSNCISWEKIKTAVDKGFANQDPNVLDRFVGDFVFNPKGVGEFRITEPQEVLEAGTGFMMIKRSVFDRFDEVFPHYSYRPDHIRSGAFDGSREIMMYFQAEIDQIDWQIEYKQALAAMHGGMDENASYSGKQIREQLEGIVRELKEKNDKKSKRYLSEDYWWCQKIQEFGAKVWLLPWIRLQHTGTYIFGGSLMDLAQVGVSATADPKALKKIA